MTFENSKISIKDGIKFITLLVLLGANWYATKMEIREQFLNAGFEAQKTKTHFDLIDKEMDALKQFSQSHELKFARIFTILSKEFDKPKQFKIESEE